MSSQIDEIQKLYAEVKTYKIPKKPKPGQKQASVKVYPLGLDKMGIMNIDKDAPFDKIVEKTREFVAISLGVKEENVDRLSLGHIEELMEAFMDANNFDEEDMKKVGIQDFIAKKKAQITEQKTKPLKPQEPGTDDTKSSGQA